MNISAKLRLNHTPDRLDATNLLLQTQQRGNSNEVISAGCEHATSKTGEMTRRTRKKWLDQTANQDFVLP